MTYIDPRVDPATRTAKVRVEVPNRKGDLRLGMYVSVASPAADYMTGEVLAVNGGAFAGRIYLPLSTPKAR